MKKLQTSCIVLFFLTLIQPSVVHVIGSCTLWWLSVAFILTEAGFHTLFTPKVKLAGVQWPLWTPPPPPPSLSQPPPSTPCGLLLRLCKQLNIQWPTPGSKHKGSIYQYVLVTFRGQCCCSWMLPAGHRRTLMYRYVCLLWAGEGVSYKEECQVLDRMYMSRCSKVECAEQGDL